MNQQTRRSGRWAGDVGQKVTTTNRFEALQEEENEEEVDWIQWCAEDKGGRTSGKEIVVVAQPSLCARGIGHLSFPSRSGTSATPVTGG